MLQIKNLTLAHGANTLLESVDFQAYPKQVVGLVGNNGTGKSSLLSAIADNLFIERGDIVVKAGARIAKLEQESDVDAALSAHDYVLAGHLALAAIYQRLAGAEQDEDYDTVMQCHSELSDCDGYRTESIIAKILIGLGFSDEDLHKPYKSFSGGWRMRLNLARCLFAPSELLLLDEPTNHLDFESIVWLQQFIRHYSGLVVIVSHDRDFLDATVSHIAHLENKSLTLYTGNYSQFELERAQMIALRQAQHKKQSAQMQHMQSYVDRFRYKASKAKQAQSRLKAIARMEQVQPFHEASPFTFEFVAPARMPDPMVTMRHVTLGYGDHKVIRRCSLSIRAGDRIGLIGVNGAGKSTFIKALCGKLQPLSGDLQLLNDVAIGYFDQHQVDALPLDRRALDYLRDFAPTKGERELTQYLASFAFDRDQSLQIIKSFSGGEKARLALARIVLQRPGLLLMDEPTNHLDMEMREALMRALQMYAGSVVLVSHDRYLLRTLVDQLYLVEAGQVEPFEGRVEDYQPIS